MVKWIGRIALLDEEIAREHFGGITERDLDDLHGYLVARAGRTPARSGCSGAAAG